MAPVEIPGYYFDESRNRWFKVDDSAVPVGQQYSSDAIDEKAKRAAEEKKETEYRDARKRLIKRPNVEYSTTLNDEVRGFPTASRNAWPARRLALQKVLPTNHAHPVEDFQVQVASDQQTETFWVADPRAWELGPGSYWRRVITTLPSSSVITHPSSEVAWSRHTPVNRDSLDPDRLLRIVEDNFSQVHFPTPVAHTIDTFVDAAGTRILGAIFARAFGSGSRLVVATLRPDDRPDPRLELVSSASDITAFCFLDADKVACGFRSGDVLVADLGRGRPHVQIVAHGSAVVDLRRGRDRHAVVAAGLRNRLALYDTRLLAPRAVDDAALQVLSWTAASARLAWRGPSGLPAWPARGAAPPTVSFPGYRNASDPRLRIAVHERLGLVATGAEGDGAVDIFSIDSGARVRTLRPPEEGPGKTVRRLRWVDDGHGVPWLYLARGNALERWGVNVVDDGRAPAARPKRRKKRARHH